MNRRAEVRTLLVVLALVAALAWLARELNNSRITYSLDGSIESGWFSMDHDSHYHMRRLARALDEGLPVAETDPRLDFPHGARIPWPPYYTYVLFALLAPFAPEEPAQRSEFVEHAVASLPCAFAVCTSMLLAAAAWRLARKCPVGSRAAAAIVAGGSFAWLRMSLDYSAPGNGDHHAWVSMLLAALLGLAARALEAESLASRRLSLWLGVAGGVTAGVLLGSWVGGFVYVLIVELALGVLLVAHARAPRAGLAPFGLAFHLALAASVLPAVLTSPWKSDLPWIVVNLSWFHLAQPLLGALVFVPLAFARAASPFVRAWPWIVAGLLTLLGLAVLLGDFALARSVRDGFAWVSRSNTFMAFVTESQPLLSGPIGGPGPLKQALGLAVFVWPVAFTWMAWRAWRERSAELTPWLLAGLVLAAQASVQRRFAEQFGVAMTLGFGWLVADLAATRVGASWRARSPWLTAPAALAVVALAQWPSISLTWLRLRSGHRYVHEPVSHKYRGFRDLYTWLRTHSLATDDYSVLATWDHGHSLEWAAERATIATNFGSYLGEDSYLDPWRFFLEEVPARAEALMAERRARYVLITSEFTKDLAVMTRLLRHEERGQFIVARPGEYGRPAPRFYRTLAGRLLLGGRVGDLTQGKLVGDSLDFLRLVYVTPIELGSVPLVPYSNGPFPSGWIWERVAGAVVEARGAPGETLELSLELEYAATRSRLPWIAGAPADANGLARVRVPYCTDLANGDGRALGPVTWRFGARTGSLAIPERDVVAGGTLAIR